MQVISGGMIVWIAGDRQRLSDTPLRVVELKLTALETNTGNVDVGGDNVSLSAGTEAGWGPLEPGDSATFEDVDLYDIYVDAAVSEEGFQWGALISETQQSN